MRTSKKYKSERAFLITHNNRALSYSVPSLQHALKELCLTPWQAAQSFSEVTEGQLTSNFRRRYAEQHRNLPKSPHVSLLPVLPAGRPAEPSSSPGRLRLLLLFLGSGRAKQTASPRPGRGGRKKEGGGEGGASSACPAEASPAAGTPGEGAGEGSRGSALPAKPWGCPGKDRARQGSSGQPAAEPPVL